MKAIFLPLLATLAGLLRNRAIRHLETLALRQQLAMATRKDRKLRFRRRERLFWIWLYRIWPGCLKTLRPSGRRPSTTPPKTPLRLAAARHFGHGRWNWIALLNPKDQTHDIAIRVSKGLGASRIPYGAPWRFFFSGFRPNIAAMGTLLGLRRGASRTAFPRGTWERGTLGFPA